MKMPDSQTFNSEAERTFEFLSDNGFSITDRTDTALTAGITFMGNHVAISLGLDRRDSCVGCYVTRVIDGHLARNNVPGGYWGHLHGFLVKHRGYRGAFKEFRVDDDSLEWYERDLRRYAAAIQNLTPEITEDSVTVFTESN